MFLHLSFMGIRRRAGCRNNRGESDVLALGSVLYDLAAPQSLFSSTDDDTMYKAIFLTAKVELR